MDEEPRFEEQPDEEWQQVREEIAVLKGSQLDVAIKAFAEELEEEGHPFQVVLEIVCANSKEVLKHIKKEDLPLTGRVRIVERPPSLDTEANVRDATTSLMLLYNPEERFVGTRYHPETLELMNPTRVTVFDSLSVKVTPAATYIGSERVQYRKNQAIETIQTPGRHMEAFKNTQLAHWSEENRIKAGVVLSDAFDTVPPIKQP